ncbi:MAG TPA: hypothetical protein VFC44_27715 [Candidatus Saccharimonadales bacterium]|nr:hypothetical protein [Candidatus Saccharimonadales bacterium]
MTPDEGQNKPPPFGSPEWQQISRESFKKHKATPTISTDAYFAIKSGDLGAAMSRKKLLYLDTCHWVNLRHVILKSPLERPGYREILDLLEDLQQQQKICCPISFFMVDEVMKQNDSATRRNTAMLMDRFSEGVCFQFPTDIRQFELRKFLVTRLKGTNASYLAGSVWTKYGFFAGEFLPHISLLSNEDNRLIQKAWIDEMWISRFRGHTGKANANGLGYRSLDASIRGCKRRCGYIQISQTKLRCSAPRRKGAVVSYPC